MKKTNRLLSMILLAAMLLTLCPAMELAAFAEEQAETQHEETAELSPEPTAFAAGETAEPPEETAAPAQDEAQPQESSDNASDSLKEENAGGIFASGTGTAENPYTITTEAQLAAFRDSVNAGNTYEGEYISLGADIAMNASELFTHAENGCVSGIADGAVPTAWTPIGTEDHPFKGTFTATGFTISGLYVNTTEKYAGLFGFVASEGGSLVNVTLSGAYIVGADYAGAVAGAFDYSISSQITAEVSCSRVQGSNAGGIVGQCRGSVSGRLVSSAVNGTDCAGGIAAVSENDPVSGAQESFVCTIELTDSTVNGAAAGGIVGTNYSASLQCTVNVKNTVNVSGTAAGGSIGINRGTNTAFSGSNSGLTVQGETAGGFIGIAYAGGVASGTNYAAVNGNKIAGGIIGKYECSADNKTTGCTNHGSVAGGEIAGGIVGTGTGYLQNCHNKGEVISQHTAGGIVGVIALEAEARLVYLCSSSGNVGGAVTAGGIVGKNTFADVEKCFNTGAVSAGTDYTGGIIGENESGKLANCFNAGMLGSDASVVGGLAGRNNGGTVATSYTCLLPVGTEGKVFALVGAMESGTCTNCYYPAGGTLSAANATSGMTDCAALASTELDKANFVNFDFTSAWTVSSRPDYKWPTLRSNSFNEAWGDITKPGDFAGGSGTKADPYIISDISHLENLRNNVNAGYGYYLCYFTLTKDIVINSDSDVAAFILGEKTLDALTAWSPIGTETYPFCGTFSAGGHVINGLVISTESSNQGFFGFIEKATVSGLVLKSSMITGTDCLGSIAAVNNGGTIDSCASNSLVMGTGDNIGGLVGKNLGVVKDSYNTGTVSSEAGCAGGIAGISSQSISGCYNAGYIIGDTAGGIAGINTRTLTNCYNIGYISGITLSGAIAGNNKVDDYGYATVSYCTYLMGTAGCTANNATGDSGEKILYSSAASENAMHSLTGLSLNGYKWKLVNSSAYPYPQISTNLYAYNWESTVTEGLFGGGSGSAESPYLIYKKEHLEQLREMVSMGYKYCGQYFKLDSSIRINPESAFTYSGSTITGVTENVEAWEPIGTADEPFCGIFNGSNYAVKGLYLAASGSSQGLFGGVHCGEINDLTISDSYICGDSIVGSVVAYLDGGTVNGCVSSAVVSGSSYVGGIVGISTGSITSCIFSGTVSGNENVGGIAGYSGYYLAACKNTGSITGEMYTGGIVGMNEGTVYTSCNFGVISGIEATGGITGINYWNINNCYNAVNPGGSSVTTVIGQTGAGGIAGTNSDGVIFNCYNAGSIYSVLFCGIIAGANASESGTAIIYNCYYLSGTGPLVTNTVIGSSTQVTNNTRLSSMQMTKQSSFGYFDFNTVWTMEGSASYSYPELIDEPQLKSEMLVTIAEIEKLIDFSVDNGTGADALGLPETVSAKTENGWRLDLSADWDTSEYIYTAVGTYRVTASLTIPEGFALAQGLEPTVTVNITVRKAVDIWNGSSADSFESGTGTKDDPYIISETTQLAYLAKTVSRGNTYAGCYFQLKADLILNTLSKMSRDENGNINGTGSATSLRSWSGIGSADAPFSGSFDGCGHTVSGVYGSKGLFGYCKNAEICDLAVADVLINGTDAGAVVGLLESGTVARCSASGCVFGSNSGGIVGRSFGEVYDCLWKGTSVQLVGVNNGTVAHCIGYGGIAGKSSGTVTDCFYPENAVSCAGTAVAASAMKNKASFSGLNFDTVWSIRTDGPSLRTGKLPLLGDITNDGAVTASDLLRMKKHLVGLSSDISFLGGDVNCDGTVSAVDLLKLKKYLAGVTSTLF